MADLRVKLLLDFIQRGKGAKDARKDLRNVKKEADGLKSAGGADRLNRSLNETSAKARKAAADLIKAKAEAKALGATNATPKIGRLERLKDMARPKERAKDALKASPRNESSRSAPRLS